MSTLTGSQNVAGLPALLTVAEFGRQVSLSRSSVYRGIADGSIRSVHIGAARRIPRSELDAFLARLDSGPQSDDAEPSPQPDQPGPAVDQAAQSQPAPEAPPQRRGRRARPVPAG